MSPRQPDSPTYPSLSAPGFGRAVVDGEEVTKDFILRADGSPKRRKKKPVKALYGTSHVIGPEELERVCKGAPKTLVIAAGYSGMAHLSKDGRAFLADRGIAVEVLPTPDAFARFTHLPSPKALLAHLTC